MVLHFGSRVIHQDDPELSALGHEEMIAAAGVVAQPGSRSLGGYGQPVDRSVFRRAPARDRRSVPYPAVVVGRPWRAQRAEDVIDVSCDDALGYQ